ncbi:LytR/AlgR family response regulator transcription factor [Streptomyces parvus]|uniref:LytR/AlgR family response regulator transcription factor n=1 Tax=Streptomyces parvus TaxID=66428 RepID=UPI00343A7D38
MRVAVVDDEQPVRSGLTLILGAAPDIGVVACCDGIDAVDRVRELRPDVLLLDIRMPEADGLTVLRQVGALTASPAVAMLTTSTRIVPLPKPLAPATALRTATRRMESRIGMA